MSNFYSLTNLSQTLNIIMLQHFNDVNKKEDDSEPASLPPYILEVLSRISFDLATLVNNDYTDENVWKNIASYAELAAKLTAEQKEFAAQRQQELAESKEEDARYEEED